MEVKPRSQFRKDLDFGPQQNWPGPLPCYGWNQQLLTGFERNDSQVLCLKGSLPVLIGQLYPSLKISELGRLYKKLKAFNPQLDLGDWLKTYKLRDSEGLEKFFRALRMTPDFFQDWADAKDLRQKDLEILNCFSSVTDFFPALEFFQNHSPSKSLGVQWLELSGELWLMGKKQTVLKAMQISDSQGCIKELQRARHPVTSDLFESKKTDFSSLSWPSQTQFQLRRQGDKDLLEVKIQALNGSDLQKKLEQLTKISLKIQESEL